MNAHAVREIALNELRLRMRSLSTLVTLLAVAGICWLAIADPAGGTTMMVIDGKRVLYNSQALAFGSAHIAALLLGLAGFYLVRGRVTQDLQGGMAAVIAATPAGNGLLTVGRWLGGMAYLLFLVLAYLGATLALHLLRGEGPVQLLVYLQTYMLLLLPMACYCAACAVLFDNIAALTGKAGDVLYFLVWCLQFAAVAVIGENPGIVWPALLDFSGLAVAVATLRDHYATTHFALGAPEFDPALAPIVMPDSLWGWREWGMRCATLGLSLLLLVPAVLGFHRYSPDRVRARTARGSRLMALMNRILSPAGRLVRPLPALAMRVPGFAGEVLAEVALVLSMSPAATAALAATGVAAAAVGAETLSGVMVIGVACWGVVVCGIVPRDWQSGADAMTAVLPGGAVRRYLRHWCAGLLLALPLLIVALRWSADMPVRAAAAAGGVLALVSAASLFGGLTRGTRLFLALFLFTWYVAINSPKLAALDMVGFNSAATAGTAAAWALGGCVALALGLISARQAAR